MEDNVLFALYLTVLAGLSTGIGSAIAFFTKRTNHKFLSFSLGLSAGVMIYVSLVEIFAKARIDLELIYGANIGYWYTVLAFFSGLLAAAIIDKLIPAMHNPHEIHLQEEMHDEQLALKYRGLKRTGMFMAAAITIHNFPEGLATFIAALQDPQAGVAIAFAIAIHNIPEGISVSVPIYYATGSRRKAFIYSLMSGLAEPLGAIFGYLVLLPIMQPAVMGVAFAMVAGIMVFISVDELLPAAREYGEHHVSIYGFICGMGIMALSLLLLNTA